jgi:hypothetical protein
MDILATKKAIATVVWLVLINLLQVTPCAQNLLLNGNFDGGNNGFVSGYKFGRTDTGQGYYDVVHNPKDSHSLGGSFPDHTSGRGLMLVANGGSNTNVVLWRESVVVSTNTSYEFSGWAASWGNEFGTSGQDPNPARVVVSINGTILGPPFQLTKTNGNWLRFSFRWSAKTNQTALIDLRLSTSAGNGNDPAFDDFQFSPLSSASDIALGVNVCWPSVLGTMYQVEYESEATNHSWMPLGEPMQGNGMTSCVFDPITAPRRFYQIRELP